MRFSVATDWNRDWAILLERDGDPPKLYLVRETKGSADPAALRPAEANKIACGRKHFAAIGVDYAVTARLSDTLHQVCGEI